MEPCLGERSTSSMRTCAAWTLGSLVLSPRWLYCLLFLPSPQVLERLIEHNESGVPMSEKAGSVIAAKLARALQQLHELKIIHRDIKWCVEMTKRR